MSAASRPGFSELSTSPALAQAARVGGYAWWYAEVHDASGRFGLTVIVFAGSVFSAEYARRLRRGEAICGIDVPAVNLAVYEKRRDGRGMRQKLWVMNEYPGPALRSQRQSITVAHSQLAVGGDGDLHLHLREPTTRFFGKPGFLVDAQLRLGPPAQLALPLLIGQRGPDETHHWQPLSLLSKAEVTLKLPSETIAFSGTAYCDHNYGSGRLEDCFARWGWSHGFSDDATCGAAVYDTTTLDGKRHRIGLWQHGRDSLPIVEDSHAPPPADEPGADGRDFLWLKVPRAMSAGTLRCTRTEQGRLLDAPFYARFGVELRDDRRLPGVPLRGVGEYLDLQRFRLPPLQFLLRYKTYLAPFSDDQSAGY